MPFKNEIEWVKNLAHSFATANGHDDPDGYAAKVAEIHGAKAKENLGVGTEGGSSEGEGNGAT